MNEIIYRMEDREHHGPFNPAIAEKDLIGALGMWKHVPWAEVDLDGLSATDAAHPHHIMDVLGLSYEAAYEAEYEGRLPIAGTYLVGCRNLRQFFHWFPKPSLPDFASEGLLLSIYECPPDAVLEGRYQVMFDPHRATLAKREPLTCPQLLAA